MKTIKFRSFLVIFGYLIFLRTAGQPVEKNIRKEFNSDKNTIINIDSKFGKTEIFNWEKSIVSIEVKLVAESDNRDMAFETLEKLNSEIDKEGDEIIIKTIIEDRITSTPRKKIKFSIDYIIYAPEWINIRLLNKYGTVFIEKIDGKTDITVQYGNLTIRELSRQNDKPLNQVTLAYSRGTIDKASWLKTDLSYSKLTIEEARAVVSVSKYSSLNSETINSLVIDSKYDTYSINTLNNFAGQLKFANIKLNEINGKLDVSSSYTNVKIEKVLPGFESLNVENSRGNYRINILKEASFNINGKAVRGDISVEGMSELDKQVVNNNKIIKGTYGNKDAKGDIKIQTNDGNVKIVIL
jgi:hypothetical protein